MPSRPLLLMLVTLLLGGCMISREGIRPSPQRPSVQGTNDAQGSPLSVPGSGMGVGSGNPAGSAPSAGAATPAR
ncbi:hypothetical protein [Noviherbaspirillum aridicola]|uniref:Lipoprotein n=1 Tax=Noviherbaspirillum aridicola TaxID=2849687 RepID=A0ABQ4Q7Z6_9BURK|nr:hypothetical protein [Noviherbaspirillum aridicola]GIZ53325.1 hypothetical protein NCCP691_33390 [Noviherbaspirillum aridicola]